MSNLDLIFMCFRALVLLVAGVVWLYHAFTNHDIEKVILAMICFSCTSSTLDQIKRYNE